MRLGPDTNKIGQPSKATRYLRDQQPQPTTGKDRAIAIGTKALLRVVVPTLVGTGLNYLSHGSLTGELLWSGASVAVTNLAMAGLDKYNSQSQRLQAYADQYEAGVKAAGRANEERKEKEKLTAAREQGAAEQRREGTLFARLRRAKRAITE